MNAREPIPTKPSLPPNLEAILAKVACAGAVTCADNEFGHVLHTIRARTIRGCSSVFGVDKFDYEEFPVGLYSTPERALAVAREKTNSARGWASDHSIATVYYAYGPQGEYLGGDTWVGE